MRVVIVGASGFLGGALATAFAQKGVHLLCTARDPEAARRRAGWDQRFTQWIAVDLARVPPASFWEAHLLPGDVVINAAGSLRERRPGEFEALHAQAPMRLFDACDRQHVAMVIQISALGAYVDAHSDYHRSKGEADRHLSACQTRSAIVQPSLVWAEEGASAKFFAALAVLPMLVLPEGGRQPFQPIHLDDLVAGVLALAQTQPEECLVLPFVGAQAVSLRHYLASLRRQLGHARSAWVLSVPGRVFQAMAALAGRWRGSFLDAATARMLLQGNAAPADAITACLQRAPRSYREFIAPAHAETLRRLAWLFWLGPLLRWSIAFVWLWTALVSFGIFPRESSLELLAQLGAQGTLATLLLYGAAAFDLVLGVATLALPAASRARWLWPVQLALIGFYTVAITFALPQFWLHPFGPISKNVPVVAAILLLWALDAQPRRTRR